VKVLRAQGIKLVVYVDDYLILADSPSELVIAVETVLKVLCQAGFTIHTEKSQLKPSQKVEFLGFVLDLESGMIRVPYQKLRSYKMDLVRLSKLNLASPRRVAATLGRIRSLITALPPVRILTDRLQQFVAEFSRRGWDNPWRLMTRIKDQIQYALKKGINGGYGRDNKNMAYQSLADWLREYIEVDRVKAIEDDKLQKHSEIVSNKTVDLDPRIMYAGVKIGVEKKDEKVVDRSEQRLAWFLSFKDQLSAYELERELDECTHENIKEAIIVELKKRK